MCAVKTEKTVGAYDTCFCLTLPQVDTISQALRRIDAWTCLSLAGVGNLDPNVRTALFSISEDVDKIMEMLGSIQM